MIGFLHQLPAGRGAGTGQVAGGEFFRSAHIEQVVGALGIGLPAPPLGQVDARHIGPVRDRPRRGLRFGPLLLVDRAEAPVLAVLQFLPGQGPADGAVAQRRHRVGDAGVHQGLGANDAAGASGAVDHHSGARVGGQFTHPQHQFGAGHAGAAGDAHGLVLVEAPGIQYHQVGLLVEQRLKFLGGQGRSVALGFHQFAKGLARHVDVLEQLAAGGAPALQAAFEQGDIAVAQLPQAGRGALGQPFALVIEGDRGGAPGDARIDLQLQFRQRDIGREQRVGFGEGRLFADIDQRQFLALEQGLTNLRRAAGREIGHCRGSFDKSQRLGSKRLE